MLGSRLKRKEEATAGSEYQHSSTLQVCLPALLRLAIFRKPPLGTKLQSGPGSVWSWLFYVCTADRMQILMSRLMKPLYLHDVKPVGPAGPSGHHRRDLDDSQRESWPGAQQICTRWQKCVFLWCVFMHITMIINYTSKERAKTPMISPCKWLTLPKWLFLLW